MSDIFSTKPGALDGLELGAPIGGGSSSTQTSGLNTTSTTSGQGYSSGHGQGEHYSSGTTGGSNILPSRGQGITGSTDDSSSGLTGNTGTGLAGHPKNTTSGAEGIIGSGRGGPTAYEADASRVGDQSLSGRTGDGYGSGGYGGQTGDKSTATAGSHHHHGQSDLDPAVAAGLGAGHHDKNLLSSGSSHPIADQYSSSSHSGTAAGLGAGAAAGGVGAYELATHSHTKTGAIGGNVSSSSGGFNDIDDKGIVTPAGLGGGSSGYDSTRGAGLVETGNQRSSGYGSGAVGAGLGAGAVGAGVGHGLQKTTGTSSQSNDPLQALKDELKHNQEAGTHSSHSLESKGPHGLVWSDKEGKYVHQRELDGHGSTGVNLKPSLDRDL